MSDTSKPITHVFDQTNGVVEGLEGESDGTVTGESSSSAERDDTGLVPGEDQPQAYDRPRDTSTIPLRDSGGETPPVGSDTTASTATATAGAQAPADQEESGVEHTFAVDRAGATTDEGPTADDTVGAGAAEYGAATEPVGNEAPGADSPTGISESTAASRESASSYDEGRADAARVTSPSTAVPVQRDDEGVTTTDAYDRGPAAEVGSNDRDDSTADTAGTSVAASSVADPTTSEPDADRTTAPDAQEQTAPSSLASLIGDDSIGHVFDQTNGVIDGIDGDSDGTAAADEESTADRHGLNEPNPVGQQDAFHDDHYGATDGRDPNP